MADDILRFTTAGSVDDGKSTLIGRLLLDSKVILEDQMAAIQRASRARGDSYLDLALMTDGLRAEREQGITIDVAYRYFATPKRTFIIADTPGHVQYTRNMVTGASTADLAIILVDARHGVVTQSRRHAFLASLLGIPHLVVAVNKMDLVDFSEAVFNSIVTGFQSFARRLPVPDIAFIPMAALHGDNVVEKSSRMPWYAGPPLLAHLEQVHRGSGHNMVDFRFPVQMALRSGSGSGKDGVEFRGYAGQVASGSISPGEEVLILPSEVVSTVVRSFPEKDGPAVAGDSVILVLKDEIDVARGDMIVRRNNRPQSSSLLDCTLCWMAEEPMRPSGDYILRHTTNTLRARVSRLEYRIDVDTLHRQRVETLGLNDIGRVSLATTVPLHFDPYAVNRSTGSFILIDPASNATVAAGMIRGTRSEADSGRTVDRTDKGPGRGIGELPPASVFRPRSGNTSGGKSGIGLEEREAKAGHSAAVLWFTGLSGSGKSTVAQALERRLFDAGARTFMLDGDHLRHGLCGDLDFSEASRRENIRRAAEVARLAFCQGFIVICSFVSPYARDRDFARSLVPQGRFMEIYMDCDVGICEKRDPKGLYARARAGQIPEFTGISAPYEVPVVPELRIDSALCGCTESVESILREMEGRGWIVMHKDEQ